MTPVRGRRGGPSASLLLVVVVAAGPGAVILGETATALTPAAPPAPSSSPPAAGAVTPAVEPRSAAAEASPVAATAASRPSADASLRATASPTATMALDRAAAAYEYGDMNQMVEAARPVAEGTLAATTDQRADALMLLGIGLFLTNRSQGAGIAFVELMRLRPTATMNPTTTRPEVVAFFQDLRRRHDDEIRRERRAQKSPLWNLLPPVGQLKNGDTTRGVVLLAVGGAAATGAALTYHWLSSNRLRGDTYRDPSEAVSMRNFNYACVGLFVVTYLVGVADGFLRYDHDPDTSPLLAAWPGRPGASFAFGF